MCECTSVRAHPLRDYRLDGWNDGTRGRRHYRNLVADENWRCGWISFDALTYNPDDDQVYCGLNSIDGDLLYKFDPSKETFTSLDTKRWTDAFDVKIHRGLLYNRNDGCLYFATSLLHDVDQQREAKGGKLVRYHLASDTYEVLGIPVPMLYVQSITADFGRSMLYGFTYPAEAFFSFDLSSRRSRILAYTGNSLFLSQPHIFVVDHTGWVWGTYAETRAWDETVSEQPIRLFKYHPDDDRFIWFDRGLPRRTERNQLLGDPEGPSRASFCPGETRHCVDHGFCDSMLFDGQRYIYAGTVAGVLSRIDTVTDTVEKIANVTSFGRLPALCMADDGTLYGAGGTNGNTYIMRWRPGQTNIETYFNLRDSRLQDGPARIHDMAVGRNQKLYLAENDNHQRSSYLWTTTLPEE